MPRTVRVRVGDRWYTVEVGDLNANPVSTMVDGVPVEVDVGDVVRTADAAVQEAPAVTSIAAPVEDAGEPAEAVDADDESASARPPPGRGPQPRKEFYVPLSGMIVTVAVEAGDQVVTGDDVCVLEAMKMHQTLRADWSGIVKAVHVEPGQQVREGDLIAELE